jgi:molecular chaperone DnaK (HSP70)
MTLLSDIDSMSVAIGIDLGTTNTVVAAVVDGVAVTLEDEQNRRLLPSVVSFHPSTPPRRRHNAEGHGARATSSPWRRCA